MGILNVVPYDRFDRARGGQRSGTAKLFTTQMCSGLVQMLQGTMLASAPASFTPVTTVISDTFNGSSNTHLDQYITSGFASPQYYMYVASAATSLETLYNNGGAAINVNLSIASSPPGLAWSAGGTNTNGAQLGSLPLTGAYQVTVVIPSTAEANPGIGVAGRLATKGTGTTAVNAVFLEYATTANTVGTLTLLQNGSSIGSAALSAAQATWANPHTIVLEVGPTYLVAYVDGVQMFIVVNSLGAAQNYAGMFAFVPATPTGLRAITSFSIVEGTQNNSVQVVPRTPIVTAVACGNVWQGQQVGGESGTWTLTEASGQSSPPLQSGVLVMMATYAGIGYLVDGTSIVQYNLGTNTVSTYTATAGTAPTNCRFAVTWRGRLVLSGNVNAPHVLYMSRIGVQTDWDYTQTDAPAAWESSLSIAGAVGEPITALIPFNDDVLIVGGDHNIFMVTGDPLQSGAINLVTDGVGILQQNAWCKDPTGTVYFLGTGGLYMMQATGAPPTILSATSYDIFFRQVDPTLNYISLTYDIYRHGIYIFITPSSGAGGGISVFYDLRNQGFWPIQYPANIGPTASSLFLGNNPNQSVMMLGGFDGYIRNISDANTDDDGTAIRSSLTLGPFQPAGPVGDAVVTSLDMVTGENNLGDPTSIFNVVWTLTGGKTAYEVTQGTEVVAGYPRRFVAGTFTYPSFQSTRNVRLRGGWFAVTLSNNVDNTYWSMEHVVLNFEKAGKQR